MFKVTVLQKGECKKGFRLLGRNSRKEKEGKRGGGNYSERKNTCENESERKQRGGERGGKREREKDREIGREVVEIILGTG